MQKLRMDRCELHAQDGPPPGGAGGAAPLLGGPWALVSYGPLDAPLPAAGAATISFDGARVTGSTGCNNFAGGYEAGPDQLTFTPLAMTRRACLGDELNRQERAVAGALSGAVAYALADGQLRILYDEGRQALVYAAPAAGATSDAEDQRQEESA